MKDLLISRLIASKGRILTISAAAVVGLIIRLLTQWGITLSPDDLNLVTGIAFFAVGWLIDAILLRINAKGVEAIQINNNNTKGVDLIVDGFAGANTQEAASPNQEP